MNQSRDYPEPEKEQRAALEQQLSVSSGSLARNIAMNEVTNLILALIALIVILRA